MELAYPTGDGQENLAESEIWNLAPRKPNKNHLEKKQGYLRYTHLKSGNATT